MVAKIEGAGPGTAGEGAGQGASLNGELQA
jgi:hypothetical protein